MSLTKRQILHYQDTVDVWKGPGAEGIPIPLDANQTATNLIYAPLGSPNQIGVPCMLQTQMEGNRYERPLGRTAFDNIFTLDRLFVEVGTDIQDQDVVRLTTQRAPPHPLAGSYFIVQGEGSERENRSGRFGNYKAHQLKRTNEPPSEAGTAGSAYTSGFRAAGFRTSGHSGGFTDGFG